MAKAPAKRVRPDGNGRSDNGNGKIHPDVLRTVMTVADQAAERAAKRAVYRVQKEATRTAVHETLEAMGISVATPESRAELFSDMRWLRKLRQNMEARPGRLTNLALGGFVTLIVLLIMYGVQFVFSVPKH